MGNYYPRSLNPSLSSRHLSALQPQRRPVETALRAKLESSLRPAHLEVVNESHQHAVPAGSEDPLQGGGGQRALRGLSLIQRHRLVHEAVREEMAAQVHALSIHARTPRQWADDPTVDRSPPCLGGSKHDRHGAGKPSPAN
ncbi:LOW QUALITY PROTEIN: bolA-like protein 1 [Pristis pectinata]|uniref:LOW QUALITY PROTEIN: bolA-like protein 1 n=1 Tax=Pristis pectinata TaxID=685728 RepID=UPI00223D05C1|nr:LOW QUALITY PROTEIN: bolA-like protein 1 [Pristis pectinata]